MPDQIEVRGLRLFGTHGVRDFEKQRPQAFDVDVVLHTDLRPSSGSDSLADTVSYSDIIDEVARVVQGPHADLVETLAERIAQVLLAYDAAQSVEVAVSKPKAMLAVEVSSVGVCIFRP